MKIASSDLIGLIVMGGKSARMGKDKATIQYHDKPHAQYLFELLNQMIPDTYVSVREVQEVEFTKRVIPDNAQVGGPLNGLLSAFELFPTKACLALAVDLPFITTSTILRLIENRDKEGFATALGKAKGHPEPLIAIWEPRGLEMLQKSYLSGETVYPKNFLIDHKVKILIAEREEELFNVNDPYDLERAKSLMNDLKLKCIQIFLS